MSDTSIESFEKTYRSNDKARNIVGQATDRAAEVRGRLRKEVAEFIAGQMFPE